MSSSLSIATTVATAAKIRKVVWSVSVHTTVFTPPRNVYNNMMQINTTAIAQNGIPQPLNTNSYSTKTTRYIRNADPISLEMIKNKAPVRSDVTPNRCSR